MPLATDSPEHLDRVRELSAGLGPFQDPQWRDDLALLSGSVRISAVALANDCHTLVALAARVPRSPGDERGGTPWASFLREVAVARCISDRAAHGEVALAHALLSRHPRTLSLLERGQAPAHRARLLVEECAGHPDPVAAAAEQLLAGRLAMLPPWRIRQEVALLVLRLDAAAAARQEAQATAARAAVCTPLQHAQAEVVLTGPAVQILPWWEQLTARARALKAAGDPRTLDALRFDLATQPRPTGPGSGTGAGAGDVRAGAGGGAGRDSDARCTRPVQAHITVPAGTALSLTQEPGWLDGYGWISAPLSRALLTDAELRKACVAPRTGQLIDLADRIIRPPRTPSGRRAALRRWCCNPTSCDPSSPTPSTSTTRPRHCGASPPPGTGSATAPPAPASRPAAPTTTTNDPGRPARPPPGT